MHSGDRRRSLHARRGLTGSAPGERTTDVTRESSAIRGSTCLRDHDLHHAVRAGVATDVALKESNVKSSARTNRSVLLLIFLAVSSLLVVATEAPSTAATYTWFQGKAQNNRMLYETSGARQFSRTGVAGSVKATGNAFRMTVWIGSASSTGRISAQIDLGYLTTKATKARWVFDVDPTDPGKLEAGVCLTGVPSGGMRSSSEPSAMADAAKSTDPGAELGSVITLGGQALRMVGKTPEATYWTYGDDAGQQHLVADFGSYVASAAVPVAEYLASGVELVSNAGRGEQDRRAILLPPGFTVQTEHTSLDFEHVSSELITATGSSENERLDLVGKDGTLAAVRTLAPVS